MRIHVVTAMAAIVLVAACSATDEPTTTSSTAAPTVQTTEAPTTTSPTADPESTSTTATTPPASTTAASDTTEAEQVVLGSDGLGVVAFGDPIESALPVLEALLGPPTREFAYEGDGSPGDCFGQTGYGCEKVYRSITWEDAGLSVVFADADSYRSDRVPHLSYWSSFGLGENALVTTAGIAAGATPDEVLAAYAGDVEFTQNQCSEESMFLAGEEPHVRGMLSGAPDDPGTIVTSLWAGDAGSC